MLNVERVTRTDIVREMYRRDIRRLEYWIADRPDDIDAILAKLELEEKIVKIVKGGY